MTAILFWVGAVGLFFDWRYLRRGGERPTTREKKYLAYAIGISIAGTAGFVFFTGNAAVAGEMSALLASTVLVLWSFRRWRVRRAHPAQAAAR